MIAPLQAEAPESNNTKRAQAGKTVGQDIGRALATRRSCKPGHKMCPGKQAILCKPGHKICPSKQANLCKPGHKMCPSKQANL